MFQYNTEKFNLDDDDILWEKFMCFVRLLIPYENELNRLSETQKYPVIAFIYESEVWGDGHIGFMELYKDWIKISDVINSFEKLSISLKYIENLKAISATYISPDEEYKQSADDEEFEKKLQEIDELYDIFDKSFYQNGNEEIEDKILVYLRKLHFEFFDYK